MIAGGALRCRLDLGSTLLFKMGLALHQKHTLFDLLFLYPNTITARYLLDPYIGAKRSLLIGSAWLLEYVRACAGVII